MAKFEPNKPIITREPSIIVDAGMPPGEYRFQLIVQDNEGHSSVADEQIVRIIDRIVRPRSIDEPEPETTPPPATKRSRKRQ